MHAPIIYIPLAIEWVILITAFMPRLLAGMFYNTPRFGLTLWFTYLGSTVLASGLAIALTFWALLDYFDRTWGADSIELELLSHFGLWILVAITGIVISLINLRTEPLIIDAGVAKQELAHTGTPAGDFHGHPVRELEFALPLAFVAKIDGRQTIHISDGSVRELTPEEFEAMNWHEVGHIKGHHSLINSIAKYVALLLPMFSASKIFLQEVRQLTELMADSYAKRHAEPEALQSARAKFLE